MREPADRDEENKDGPSHGRSDREELGIPPWAKLALTVIGTTVTTIVAMFLWVSTTFVSRVEYLNHATQQALDMERLTRVQASYAIAEKGTADNLSTLAVDIAEIRSDVAWLRDYLDLSRPPKKNGKAHP